MAISSVSIALLCFHGSPGGPEDFDKVENRLPEVRFIKTARYGEQTGEVDWDFWAGADLFLVGYSWGAAEAVLAWSRDERLLERVRGFILISPYLFPRSGLSFFGRLLIEMPWFGNFILNKVGNKKIDEMLTRSASPQPVPPQVAQAALNWKNARVLKQATLEKEGKDTEIATALKALSDRKLPVGLIVGSEDQTSLDSEQIAPLRKDLSIASEIRISNAGHALLWTHAVEVSAGIQRFLQKEKRK